MSELDLNALMQQAQQLQSQMQDMQKGLESRAVEGAAGAGLVKVECTGAQRITKVEIDPAALEEDQEMLQDLIAAAVNNALDKAKALAQEQMGSLLPPGFNVPGT